mmetsp:Transcript_98938/g.159509  ORF Transcript_98938/g.159509 Transcript_98938/m.159509 type:complete len:94 (-) Transcript_98938:462-743(-)
MSHETHIKTCSGALPASAACVGVCVRYECVVSHMHMSYFTRVGESRIINVNESLCCFGNLPVSQVLWRMPKETGLNRKRPAKKTCKKTCKRDL